MEIFQVGIYLIATLVLGKIVISYLLPQDFRDPLLSLIASFLLGTFFLTWIVFLSSLLLKSISLGLYISTATVLAFFLLYIFFQFFKEGHFPKLLPTKNLPFPLQDGLVTALAILFSFWFATQNFSSSEGILRIGSNVWGDFDVHIPLIRSFSLGNNLPPQPPFFPGVNLAYHFLSHFSVAVYEFLSSNLSFAINFFSVLTLSSFLILIYKLPQYIFSKGPLIGIVAVILFLFNGSLGFTDALKKLEPKDPGDFIVKVWTNDRYLSVAPFENDKVAIMWNLNVYANQRHLILAFALALLFIFFLSKVNWETGNKLLKTALLGTLVGLLPFLQLHTFLGLMLYLLVITALDRKRKFFYLSIFLLAGLIALPQLLWLAQDSKSFFVFNPGFLSQKPLTIFTFLNFWTFNLGFTIIAVILGLRLATKEQRILFYASSGIFIVANIFQFNKVLFNNHKFFNLWLLLANFYSAYFLVTLWRKKYGKLLFVPLVLFLTFSGIIDFMVLKNQTTFQVPDYPKSPLAAWVKNSTPSGSVFLVPYTQMYDQVTLAGRKIYQPYPRYASDFGYNTEERNALIRSLYRASSSTDTISTLRKNNIDYVVLPLSNNLPSLEINYSYYTSNFKAVFANDEIAVIKIE